MQAGEALRQAATHLHNEGVDSPRLDADLLLAHVLGVNRAAVLARPERVLTPKELTRFRALVARRGQREPLAYIVGHREFYGLEFAVGPHVLVPRPETELLVETALGIVRGREGPFQIADVGTGSGAVAVTLAHHLPSAMVYALDASADALEVASLNAHRHGVSDRVRCLLGDLLKPLPGSVSLITANLPYVTSEEWQGLAPEIRLYEPRTALDGGPDGLDHIRSLLDSAGSHLHRGGSLLLEIGASQGAAVSALARDSFPRARIDLRQDYAGLDRLVMVETD